MGKEWAKQFIVASVGFIGLMSVMMVTQLNKHNELLDQSLMNAKEDKSIEAQKIVLTSASSVHNLNQ